MNSLVKNTLIFVGLTFLISLVSEIILVFSHDPLAQSVPKFIFLFTTYTLFVPLFISLLQMTLLFLRKQKIDKTIFLYSYLLGQKIYFFINLLSFGFLMITKNK